MIRGDDMRVAADEAQERRTMRARQRQVQTYCRVETCVKLLALRQEDDRLRLACPAEPWHGFVNLPDGISMLPPGYIHACDARARDSGLDEDERRAYRKSDEMYRRLAEGMPRTETAGE